MLRFLLYILIIMLFSQWAYSEKYQQKVQIPLKGMVIDFKDPKGPYDFETQIIHYESKDRASIEATILIPKSEEKKEGLVFVHMWARDRHTFWGLPQYLATYGYPSIYMDLRGHGNSNFPNSKRKIKPKDKSVKYAPLINDIIPAIDLLNQKSCVKKDNLIMIGASLGCPLGVIAVEKRRDLFKGLIFLAPALVYFDVNCKSSLKKISHIPCYVISEKKERTFRSAKHFFSLFGNYKCFFPLDGIGHGTDILYHDIGFAGLILSWIKDISQMNEMLKNLKDETFLVQKS